MRLTRPPAATPLHKEPKGSPGPPPARPDLAPGSELRIPTKWCPATRGSDGDHFRDANQDPHGTDCARHRGLQSGEVCGGLRVGSCSRTYLLIRGAGDLWRAARNPKAATRHKVCALPERPAPAGPPLVGWLASKKWGNHALAADPSVAYHPNSRSRLHQNHTTSKTLYAANQTQFQSSIAIQFKRLRATVLGCKTLRQPTGSSPNPLPNSNEPVP